MSNSFAKIIGSFAFLALASVAHAEEPAWTPARIDQAENDAAKSHDLQLKLPGIDTPAKTPDVTEIDPKKVDLTGLNWLWNAIGGVGQLLFWGVIACVVVLLILAAARELPYVVDWLERRRGRQPDRPDRAVSAAPSAEVAATLLEDADRLAASGQYAEAVRLLLYRTLEDISRRMNRYLPPALTSREILVGTALAPAGRDAFDDIVSSVEQSYFGGRAFGAADYARCRDSYERFALSGATV